MPMIDALLGPFLPYIAGAIAAVVALLAAYFKGGANAKAKAENKALNGDLQAHERMNDAPTLRNSSDADRIGWLRKFADRNRRD